MPTLSDEFQHAREAAAEHSTHDEGSGLGLPRVDKGRVFAGLFEENAEPETVGRFVVERRLGQGGMGTVMQAYDPQLDRKVALKLLHGAAEPRHQQRLLREAQALARLSHRNVVSVFEVGEAGGHLFIAMELVVGTTLTVWQQQAHPWRECLEVYLQAGRGLAAAHAVGIVHRDFKPSNCMLDEAGVLRVLDFGLARGLADLDERDRSAAEDGLRSSVRKAGEQESSSEGSGRALEYRITQSDTLLGTPAYMAPEQAQLQRVDAAADQFSFCLALYEALYGQRPFRGLAGLLERMDKGGTPPFEPAPSHAQQPRVPGWLRAVLARGLAFEPSERFPDISTLLEEVEGRLRARRLGAVTAVVATGLLATVATTRAVSQENTGPDCALGQGAVAQTWNAETKAAVRSAFEGSEQPFAVPTHRAVERSLQRWADGWEDARGDACRATHEQGVASEALLDRRMDCLELQSRETAALIDIFVAADAATVARAPELLAQVPSPTSCHHPVASDAEQLPDDPQTREAVLEGYEQLARARGRLWTGVIAEAEQLTEAASAVGQDHGFRPLELESQIVRGELAWMRSHFDEAADLLTGVAYQAVPAGLRGVELKARRTAVNALVGRWSKPELEAMLIDELSAAASRGASPSQETNHDLLAARARHAKMAGEYERALSLFATLRAQGESLEGVPRGNERLDEADTLSLLARHGQASALLLEGLPIVAEAWGEHSPTAARFEQVLGMLALEVGDVAEADTRLSRARSHLETALGLESVPVARVRFAQAKLAMTRGAFEQAASDLVFVGTVFERELGPQHRETGELYNALGVARFYESDFPGSVAAYKKALVVALVTYGPAHAEVALLHSNLAESRAAMGEHVPALDEYASAFAIMEVSLPPEHPMLAQPSKGRGQSLLALGRTDESIRSLERALTLLQRPPLEPFEVADTKLSLARALQKAGRDSARSVRLAGEAAAGFDTLGFDDRADQARSLLSPTSSDD
ncbi:MAG: serine/threonine-protein kinase [Nannocystales bacterium]